MTVLKAISSAYSHPEAAPPPLPTSTDLAEARRELEVMGLLTLADGGAARDARGLEQMGLLALTIPRHSRGLDELSLAAGSRYLP